MNEYETNFKSSMETLEQNQTYETELLLLQSQKLLYAENINENKNESKVNDERYPMRYISMGYDAHLDPMSENELKKWRKQFQTYRVLGSSFSSLHLSSSQSYPYDNDDNNTERKNQDIFHNKYSMKSDLVIVGKSMDRNRVIDRNTCNLSLDKIVNKSVNKNINKDQQSITIDNDQNDNDDESNGILEEDIIQDKSMESLFIVHNSPIDPNDDSYNNTSHNNNNVNIHSNQQDIDVGGIDDSPKRCFRKEVTERIFDEIWPEIIQELKPFLTHVVQSYFNKTREKDIR